MSAKRNVQSPEEIAARLLKDMQGRFVKLDICAGDIVEDTSPEQMRLMVGVKGRPKLGCEAIFPVGIAYERIKNSFHGWAETHARKLGVKKFYANVKSEDDEDMDEAA